MRIASLFARTLVSMTVRVPANQTDTAGATMRHDIRVKIANLDTDSIGVLDLEQ